MQAVSNDTQGVRQSVNVERMRAMFAHYINQVEYHGHTIYITRRGRAVAKVVPVSLEPDEQILAKNPGKMQGK